MFIQIPLSLHGGRLVLTEAGLRIQANLYAVKGGEATRRSADEYEEWLWDKPKRTIRTRTTGHPPELGQRLIDGCDSGVSTRRIDMDHGEMHSGGWGGEMLLSGLLFSGLLLAVGAVFVVLLLRNAGVFGLVAARLISSSPSQPRTDSALVLLRERYARGEIDTAEYEERRQRLLDELSTI
jgi:putative membrane protein